MLPRIANRAMQLIILGTGEPQFEKFFGALCSTSSTRQVAYKRGFSEPLAQLIEAGSDMFLMPSRATSRAA